MFKQQRKLRTFGKTAKINIEERTQNFLYRVRAGSGSRCGGLDVFHQWQYDGGGLRRWRNDAAWSSGADLVDARRRCTPSDVDNGDVGTAVELFLCAAAETRRAVHISTPAVSCARR